LLALSANNPEWKYALSSRDMHEVDLVLKANARLEEQKAVAVSSGTPQKVKGEYIDSAEKPRFAVKRPC
jgi:hypothetical protein